jgi:heptosyltransferase-2
MPTEASVTCRRPSLLVLELWGVGDLALTAPFLAAAARDHEVHLLAKPAALELQSALWPSAQVHAWSAPWTAFQGKYRLARWPWRELLRTLGVLRSQGFDCGVSARPDPRDHLWLRLAGVRLRAGFPRAGSARLLNHPLALPPGPVHRYDCWRRLADWLGTPLPAWKERARAPRPEAGSIIWHSGAAQPVRVWPLDRCLRVIRHLRKQGRRVRVLCDPAQLAWWQTQGERDAVAPGRLAVLREELRSAAAFIGNDSGPGHLAAVLGVPTFTLFGPQLPGLFHPIHPDSEWLEGKPCRWKPCFDSCRMPSPHCLLEVTEAEVLPRLESFLVRTVPG